MTDIEYWKECIEIAAEECNLELTAEQLDSIAGEVSVAHDQYGMVFPQPPASDRISVIEKEWEAKLARLEGELEAYQRNANTAIKQALGVHRDDNVSIGEHGEVELHGGSTTRIQ